MDAERLAAIRKDVARDSGWPPAQEVLDAIDALQAENERLRESLAVTDIEGLSAELHAIYQAEARRQAGVGDDTVRHPDDYAALAEHTKEYDRVLARFIIARESALQARITLLEGAIAELVDPDEGTCAQCGRGLDISECSRAALSPETQSSAT